MLKELKLFDHVFLNKNNIRLIPLSFEHESGLMEACKDGQLWKLRVTSTPHYSEVHHYIETALIQKNRKVHVIHLLSSKKSSGKILGTTSYHDVLLNVKRLEIGYTWYAKSVQRTHVNTTCKLLLLQFAFEQLNTETVGLRTDIFNIKSQRAIERLGAKKDGIIRGHALRKDGTTRDTVMYSIIKSEWTNIKAHLIDLLDNY
ncbi:GNAT family N-acetyltransferase [Acinetobacter sp. PW68]|uniref:GNAT family N-acetyltransferase n=1 Tax=Acinetobacter sp. PW68 TaxID=2865162 RepID=UPI001E50505D|nr:GNAT family protein [Acinetobacter sp. PW68]MCD0189427.1 GNAT family N-acetyltransferase [Acinetobacter sp. PW68]